MRKAPLGIVGSSSTDRGLLKRLVELKPFSEGEVTTSTVVLLLDCSTSMAGSKLQEMTSGCLEASASLVRGGSACTLIEFQSIARLIVRSSTSESNIRAALSELKAKGSTNMSAALEMARVALCFAETKLIVLITDGQPDNPQTTLEEASAAKAEGCIIRCIGVTGADQDFLDQVAGGEATPVSVVVEAPDLRKTITNVTALSLPSR